MNYEACIGLEVHVQLKTRSKMFCGCATRFGEPPNTLVCPVCLGYPGAMPTMNEEALKLTCRAGLLIGSTINRRSKFDRKNYFYPDMPKNYQISQYDRPLCLGGHVDIEVDGRTRRIGVTRIHQEEDVGKNTHFEGVSGVDFNRAGTPLMELVTEPDLRSADEAFAFLQALKQILLYGEIGECNLERGQMRCDVNCSVRPVGQTALGTKTEIKNMNTFKGVHRALIYEIRRQIDVLRKGGTIRQETRRWDDEAGVTSSMRGKEDAHDYRYFPEPDLMPIVFSEEEIEAWRAALPELPVARRARFVSAYGLPEYDAGVLVADKRLADFYEQTARISGNFKAASNWIMTDVLRLLSARDIELTDTRLTPDILAGLIGLVDRKVINMPTARELFEELFDKGGDPEAMVKERGLAQVSDSGALEELADRVIAENEKSVNDFRAGKAAALQHLVGQIMRHSKGKANPQAAAETLKRKIG